MAAGPAGGRPAGGAPGAGGSGSGGGGGGGAGGGGGIGAGGYDVSRPQGRCASCSRAIEPDERFMTALRETPEGFQRLDVDLACWEGFDRSDVLAFWQTVMPRPEQKKKLFVDDAVLCEVFERLASAEEPAKVAFRFVLGLILMRKRLLVYEDTRREGEREIWKVRLRGRQDAKGEPPPSLDLVNPHLDEQQVREVSGQLGEILQQEL